jgi:hypothetical protein
MLKEFSSLSVTQKATVLAFACLVVLSFLGLLVFLSVSVVSLLGRNITYYWSWCFLLCATALGGWMVLYTAQLRLAGGLTIYRNNLLLFIGLLLAVFISATLRFASPQKYVALSLLVLSLIAFYLAVPSSPRLWIWLLTNGRHGWPSRSVGQPPPH